MIIFPNYLIVLILQNMEENCCPHYFIAVPKGNTVHLFLIYVPASKWSYRQHELQNLSISYYFRVEYIGTEIYCPDLNRIIL